MEEADIKMQSGHPSISVVIPVKNEAFKIRACLDGILSQSIPINEIIVIDSGSTDGTIDVVKKYQNVTLIEIPAFDFNHGETRNIGVQKATSEFILLTVGDARPYNKCWIEELLKGFVDDEVAGVCGQQVVPHEKDKNPVEWFSPVSEPELKRYQFTSADLFEKLLPEQKINICGWDNVTAMYRRKNLLEIPFRKTSYSEDAIWAKETLLSGFAIVYNPKARVYHYHLEDADFTFKRNFTTMYFRYKQFQFLYKKPLLTLRFRISILKTLFKRLGFDMKVFLYWYKYNINNHKSFVRSYKFFMASLNKGEVYLDKEHELLCGKPPIPKKNN